MEFNLVDFSFVFLPFRFIIAATIIIFLLVRWSKQLETGRYKVFIYFLVSTHIGPVFSRETEECTFELWFPLGFVVVLVYMFLRKSKHPSKIKACILGACVAVYKLVVHYAG
jgi:hypothetical protein